MLLQCHELCGRAGRQQADVTCCNLSASAISNFLTAMQGCKPDTDRLTERAAAAAQAWAALQRSDAKLLCTGFASQAGSLLQQLLCCYMSVLVSSNTGPTMLQKKAIIAGLPAEANLLAAQAVSAGVPCQCVVIEDQAKNTVENALLCLPLLQQYNISHVVLVTSDYHMPRSRLLFELALNGTKIQLSWAEVGYILHYWLQACMLHELCFTKYNIHSPNVIVLCKES